ncbi:MAG: pentapeptide repeat-containing protein [Candidatus Eremiobacteraeota bacterium]|nr:pentapeptide repeat-containing protein [Candidatus Eremiobacteraeota bacterium]
MIRRQLISRVLAASLCVAVPVACAKPADVTASMTGDVAAFGLKPNVDTWAVVHGDILKGKLTPDAGSALVTALATKPIPDALMSAGVADLAQSDFLTTFVDLRDLNVTSRHQASASAEPAVARSSQIAWLMLSLRSPEDKSGINLTNMDLRFGGDFVGQGMNLSNVDFSGAVLAGGTWNGSDLTGATFEAVTTTAPLLCRSCVSGNVRATLQLVEGRWVSPSR